MRTTTPTLIASALNLVAAAPSNFSSRQAGSDVMMFTWWEAGCGVEGRDNRGTYVFSSDGPSFPGDCVPTIAFGWQSVEITQDAGQSYTVDLFSGEGCNNGILTITEDGCYTQPKGMIVGSARVSLR